VAAVELQLALDRDPAEFVGGETVEGRLEMYVRERCECRALTVYVGWLAKSRYGSDEGAQPAITLSSGVFEPGHQEHHRFAVQLDRAIWSYPGQSFQLTYAVKAKADLANLGDAHADVPIVVRPADDITPTEIAPSLGVILERVDIPVPPLAAGRTISADKLAARFQPGCMIVMGTLSILFSLPFMFGAYFMFGLLRTLLQEQGWWFALPLLAWMILGIGVPLISGLAMLYTGLRPFMARWILGDTTVDIPERLVRPGQSIPCRVVIQPERDVEIENVRLIVRARETVWRRTRKRRRPTHRTIRSDERLVEGARSARAGDYVEINGLVDIPTEGPYSLDTSNHRVEWHVLVRVALRGWIDQYSEHLITVAPIAPSNREL
jgi:hypothetical protein